MYLCARNREKRNSFAVAGFFIQQLIQLLTAKLVRALHRCIILDAHPLCKSSLKLLGYERRKNVPESGTRSGFSECVHP